MKSLTLSVPTMMDGRKIMSKLAIKIRESYGSFIMLDAYLHKLDGLDPEL